MLSADGSVLIILKDRDMKNFAYVDTTRPNADGSFPVYVVVRNPRGRFFVNTGMTTCGKLDGGVSFPRQDRNGRAKTALLARYMAECESVCLRHEVLGTDNATLKEAIRREVFGIVSASRDSLASCIREFADTRTPQTAKCYRIAADRVTEFDADATLDIDRKWLERFRQWCISKGMKVNGAGMILRCVRASFNWARTEGRTQNYPFLGYSIPEEETTPNNLSAEDIRRLRDYPCEEWQRRYIDFFMLSFYLAGMNPVDLLSLKADAVRGGHVSFVRRKTNKQGARKVRTIVLPVVDEARAIIRKYPSREGWLLGFMDGRSDYHSFMKQCEKALRKVGTQETTTDRAGKRRKVVYHPAFPDITLYTARYSFGSIAANDLDIPEQTIGQCLGHSWSRHVTARYIAHDQRKVDDAVRKVVAYISSSVGWK